MNDSYFLSAAKVDVYTSKYELFFFYLCSKNFFWDIYGFSYNHTYMHSDARCKRKMQVSLAVAGIFTLCAGWGDQGVILSENTIRSSLLFVFYLIWSDGLH